VLFEKSNLKKNISLDLLGCIFIIVIVTAYVTYGVCGGIGSYDSSEKITFLDLLNGIAQIATASAFALAVIQYRKNSIQQRQLSIATEAKSQLEKMIEVICEIKIGDDTCLKNLNKSISLLSNLATNFDELFKAMDEDIQRAIVRMQWQDMYFNYLSHSLSEINPVAILKKETSISRKILDSAISEAKKASEKAEITPALKDFVFSDKLFNHPEIKSKFTLKGKIISLDMFASHYMNDHNLNDLLYGLLSRIDIKVRAPLLAVAEPSKWAMKKPT